MSKPICAFRNSYRFLSNFYPATVELDGVEFPSVEHAYQAAKTLNKLDRDAILLMTPGEAKKYGQTLALRSDWEHEKLRVMQDLVCQKFTKHEVLRTLLIGTGTAELVEGNTWGDMFWGVDLKTQMGDNYLGRILMLVRQAILETR